MTLDGSTRHPWEHQRQTTRSSPTWATDCSLPVSTSYLAGKDVRSVLSTATARLVPSRPAESLNKLSQMTATGNTPSGLAAQNINLRGLDVLRGVLALYVLCSHS